MSNKITDLSNKMTPVMRRRLLAHIRANHPGSWLVTVRWTTMLEVTRADGTIPAAPISETGFICEGHNPTNDSKFTLFISQ